MRSVDNDTAARLHALTEGWPLGLQLSLTVLARGTDARADVAGMSALGGQLREQFLAMLLANLDARDREFLTASRSSTICTRSCAGRSPAWTMRRSGWRD